MRNLFKKLICFLVMTCILSTSIVALAEDTALVEEAYIIGDSCTVTGYGENVNIFLLNPGKTVADLNAAADIDALNAVINYTNIINANTIGAYSHTFTVKNISADDAYLLYVKAGEVEYTKELTYESVKVYVSASATEGAGVGTEANPFATIEEAKDYVRTLAKTEPIDVIIGGGTYIIKEDTTLAHSGLTFTAEDAGTEAAPITYKAKEGEKVILSGAKTLDINGIKPVTDGNILGRLDATAAGKVVEIDLAAQGLPDNVIDFNSGHTSGNTGKQLALFFNGERQTISRWPNTGYATTASVANSTAEVAPFTTLKISELPADRAEKWENAEDMYIEGYLANEWYGEWAKVDSVTAGTIALKEKTGYGVLNGHRVAAVHILEEIDMPGEWYVDIAAKKLYWYPPYTPGASDKIEIATHCQNLISLKTGANYINFKGIEFEKTANSPKFYADNLYGGNGILLYQITNVNIENCTFRNMGMDAIFIYDSKNINIDSCKVSDTGYRGVYIKEGDATDYKTLESDNIVVSNSLFTKVSRDSGRSSAAGVYISGNSVGVIIENNIFNDMKSSAIRYKGNNHIIRNNEIYNCVNNSSDAGAIYSGRSFTEYGTAIENNYFHHIGAGLQNNTANAVFWDDTHSGNTFVGNIVDMNNTNNTNGVLIGGGRDNVIKGNIFVNAPNAVRGSDREITFNDAYYADTAFQTFSRAANDGADVLNITEDDWAAAFKTNYEKIMENYNEQIKGTYTRVNEIKDNVVYNCTNDINLEALMTSDSAASTTASKVVTSTDMFVDYAGGDFRLKSAYKSALGYSDDVLDDTFSMSNIGTKTGIGFTDAEKSFGLVAPLNNSSVNADSLYLKWEVSDFADKYMYEIATDSEFSTIVKSGEASTNCVLVDGDEVSNGNTYYWRVTAINNSKQMKYEVLSDDVFMFKAEAKVWVDNVKYDSANKVISYRVTNDTASATTVKLFAALKDASGNLLEMNAPVDLPVGATNSASSTISAAFEKTGASIELYIWDSYSGLRPVAVKFAF